MSCQESIEYSNLQRKFKSVLDQNKIFTINITNLKNNVNEITEINDSFNLQLVELKSENSKHSADKNTIKSIEKDNTKLIEDNIKFEKELDEKCFKISELESELKQSYLKLRQNDNILKSTNEEKIEITKLLTLKRLEIEKYSNLIREFEVNQKNLQEELIIIQQELQDNINENNNIANESAQIKNSPSKSNHKKNNLFNSNSFIKRNHYIIGTSLNEKLKKSKQKCPFDGCNGKGNTTKKRNTHRTLDSCPNAKSFKDFNMVKSIKKTNQLKQTEELFEPNDKNANEIINNLKNEILKIKNEKTFKVILKNLFCNLNSYL